MSGKGVLSDTWSTSNGGRWWTAQSSTPVRTGAVSSSLAVTAATSAGLPATLDDLGERVRGYLDAARSANTHRAYAADWRHFAAWCAEHELVSLPAEASTLALYLTAHVET